MKNSTGVGAHKNGAGLMNVSLPLVVHSHLRWDWVWQRPQQFLTRLSARRPVLFIEEPWWDAPTAAGDIEPYCFQYQAPNFPNIRPLS